MRRGPQSIMPLRAGGAGFYKGVPAPLPDRLHRMRLSCPECDAGYELPETMFLTGPRMVRCVRCSHAWLAGKVEASAVPEAPPAQADPAPAGTEAEAEAEAGPARRQSPLRRRAATPAPQEAAPIAPFDMGLDPPTRPRTGMWVLAGWVFTFVFLGAAGTGCWLYQDDIIQAWPASARLYEVLGARQSG
jgi:predicted Zn finger-like uncharacterized protein